MIGITKIAWICIPLTLFSKSNQKQKPITKVQHRRNHNDNDVIKPTSTNNQNNKNREGKASLFLDINIKENTISGIFNLANMKSWLISNRRGCGVPVLALDVTSKSLWYWEAKSRQGGSPNYLGCPRPASSKRPQYYFLLGIFLKLAQKYPAPLKKATNDNTTTQHFATHNTNHKTAQHGQHHGVVTNNSHIIITFQTKTNQTNSHSINPPVNVHYIRLRNIRYISKARREE